MYVKRYFSLHSKPNVWKPEAYVVCNAFRLTLFVHQPSLSLLGPKCSVLLTMLFPPCTKVWLLPRDSMISISPDLGQLPYTLSTGNIQIAGHNQSPAGSFASTSMRPNLIFAPIFVLILPDLTGLIIDPFVELVTAIQSVHLSEVQIPCWVRLRMLPSVVRRSVSCKVGLM